MNPEYEIKHVIRNEVLFASIRRIVKSRQELLPQIQILRRVCEPHINGPLTLIRHFDTNVNGIDAEIGFIVTHEIDKEGVTTTTLEHAEFASITHRGTLESITDAIGHVYGFLAKQGISPALELVEIYHDFNFRNTDYVIIEVQASMHLWIQLYKQALNTFLDDDKTHTILDGYEEITPFTDIEKRALWVRESLERLKLQSTEFEQFQICSNLALTRPNEDIRPYRELYEQTGDIQQIIQNIEKNQNWKIKPCIEGNRIVTSKIPYNREAYETAKTHAEKRASYCWCSLVRNSTIDGISPIFCYRAAGWARQLWEQVIGTSIVKCNILKSVLSGDDYCEFELFLPEDWKSIG